MGKQSKKKGLLGKLLRRKPQRVTMTKAGEKLAPMRKGKAKKAAKKAVKQVKSGKEKQVQELKTLAAIGKRDPERLAAIISKMLQQAFEDEEDARLKFERMIWDKAEGHRPDEKDPGGERP